MRISDWSSDVCSSDLAGDIYQANLTFRADVPVLGDPLAAYARLRRTARAGYGGFLWTGRQAIASLSPEIFFALRGGQVVARPLKGTVAPLRHAEADAAAARQLEPEPNQPAQTPMNVDLTTHPPHRLPAPGDSPNT